MTLEQVVRNDYDENVFNPEVDKWATEDAFYSNRTDKANKENNEKLCKIFQQGFEIIKCNYHNLLKNASKSAEKFNKINDKQRKQFIDGVNQIDKTMNQTNCNMDKDTLFSYKRTINKKVKELMQILGERYDPEFYKFVRRNSEINISTYFKNLYLVGMIKHGKKPDMNVRNKFIEPSN